MARGFSAYLPETAPILDRHGFDIDSGDGYGDCPSCGDGDCTLFRVKATGEVYCADCWAASDEAEALRQEEWAMDNTLRGSDEELGLVAPLW